MAKSYRIPVTFQKWFPVHYYESERILDLIRAFSRDVSGFDGSKTCYSKVYLWRDGAWKPTTAMTGRTRSERENPWPTPLTPLRVVVVLGDDPGLFGAPVSLQLLRTDTWPDTEGPVYKIMVERLERAEEHKSTGVEASDGKGDPQAFEMDPGLLPEGPEAEYLPRKQGDGDDVSEKHYYGFVFYPFYLWRLHTFFGAKPTGFVPFDRNQSMDVRFRMKVRDTWYKVGDSDGKEGDVIRVHLTGPDSVATSFTLDRDFLYRKTAQEPPLPVFLGDTWLAGTCLKPLKGDDWHVFTAHDDELLSAGFAFDWTKPFEAIFLIGTTSYDSRWEDVTDHLFPVKIQVKEDGAVGPTYSARGIALEDPGKGQVKLEEEVHTQREMVYRTRRFGEFVSVENLTEFLSFVQVLGAGERITSHVHLKGTGVATSQTFKPDAKGRFCGLAAVRVRFAYGVQKYGDHLVCRAFKPFGEKARRGSGAEPFKYTFTLQVPGQKGQPETVKLGHKIAFPPLPPEREIGDDWDHLRQDRFVTRKELWPMLDIWEVDYAEK